MTARCYNKSTINDGYKLKCVSVWGDKSNTNNQRQSIASCPNDNYFMTSCSAYSPTADVHSYLVNDTSQECIASDYGGTGWVTANAIWLSNSLEPFVCFFFLQKKFAQLLR